MKAITALRTVSLFVVVVGFAATLPNAQVFGQTSQSNVYTQFWDCGNPGAPWVWFQEFADVSNSYRPSLSTTLAGTVASSTLDVVTGSADMTVSPGCYFANPRAYANVVDALTFTSSLPVAVNVPVVIDIDHPSPLHYGVASVFIGGPPGPTYSYTLQGFGPLTTQVRGSLVVPPGVSQSPDARITFGLGNVGQFTKPETAGSVSRLRGRTRLELPAGVVCRSQSGHFPGCDLQLYDVGIDLLDPAKVLANSGSGALCSSLDTASPVVGAAADGVSLVLLRLHGRTQGEVFTVGLPSGAGNENGWLRALGNSADVSVLTTTANCRDASGGYLAYAIYRAPLDFAWNAAQQSLAQRTVQVIAQSPSSNQASLDIIVVRPPVVLVHGFSSTADETWNSFPFYTNPPTTPQGQQLYHVFPVNYGTYLRDEGMLIAALDGSPESPIGEYDQVRRSHLGLPANWKRVADDARDAIKVFRLGINPTGRRVVASQADFVAHSMGGLLVRYWALQPDYRASSEHPGQGYAHKLVTIGTPHFGSPQATLSLEPNAWCSRWLAKKHGGVYSFSTADVHSGFGTYAVPGAAASLMGDGIGGFLSLPLELIRSGYGGVPIAALAGDSSSLEFNLDYSFAGLYIRARCVVGIPLTYDPIARRMNGADFATLFDPTIRPGSNPQGLRRRSDGAVPLTSALMDWSALTCTGPNCFDQKAHSQSVGSYFYSTAQVGSPIHLLDWSSTVSLRVLGLLNTPVNDSTSWSVR